MNSSTDYQIPKIHYNGNFAQTPCEINASAHYMYAFLEMSRFYLKTDPFTCQPCFEVVSLVIGISVVFL